MIHDINDMMNSYYQENTLAFPGITKFDPDDAQPDYVGLNTNPDALDNDDNWMIYSFTYSGTAATQIVRRIGSWTGRAALFA